MLYSFNFWGVIQNFVLGINVTAVSYQQFFRTIGFDESAMTSRSDRAKLIKGWLNVEEDTSIVDIEVLDFVSCPIKSGSNNSSDQLVLVSNCNEPALKFTST